MPFPAGKITKGREAIRKFFSTIDAKDVELNVLLANNLTITVVDEKTAKGSCYVTHLQHLFEDSNREGMGVLRVPNSVTEWHWNFELVEGEWKIGEVDVDLVLLNERFLDYFSE